MPARIEIVSFHLRPSLPRALKVAINGAGVAGPTLAYWLHKSGDEPTLIEQAPGLRTGGYVIDFWGAGYTVAERMGILPAVREAGYSIEEVRFVDARGRRAGGFSADVFRRMTEDRFTSLPRGDLAAIIFGTVQERIETVFSDSISAIDEHEAGAHVRFERGAPRDFDLVVGADGLHSKVRELVFGPEKNFERRLGYSVAAFEVGGYSPRDELAYVSHARPGRQVSRFALRQDRTMFLFVFVDALAPGAVPQDVAGRKRLLHRVFGDAGWECPQILQAMDTVEDVYLDRVSQIRMDRWSKGRVMLIGDAASCVSLLAGEGTGLAMTEAYVLAGELQGANGDHRKAFGAHERRLRTFIEGKQHSAERFAPAFAPKTAAGVLFRNQVSKLLRLPPIANLLIGRDLMDDIDLPGYGM